MFTPAKTLVIPLFGVFVLAASAMAQSADQSEQSEATGAPTSLAAVQPASENTPPAIDDTTRPLDQGVQASMNLGQAEHSAEAHKSLNDPNNQMSTNTSGRTRPIVEANGAQPDPAVVPPKSSAQ